MSRYIDVDVLRYVVLNHANKQYCEGNHDKEEAFTYCLYLIDCMPTADVVEVVRCKDCKWYEINELRKDGEVDRRYKPSVCGLYQRYQKETYFCADGERKEETDV